ncbi:MAG: hypothetical protein KGD64_15100 [Candidatus Heimdallarchaeota archaeon]|nr:hypothetical protein [Candidatus Heimdallarchaeota archaeon]
MELNNFKTYLAFGIVGLVVGILYLIIQKDISRTLTIFYITLYVVVSLRYILERRHYRKHKAILASTQFLLLPFSILLMGHYISPFAYTYEIFKITSSGNAIQMYFNLVSLSLIIPVIILTLHFNNYYSGKWPAIAIRRKVKKSRSIPLLIHSFFIFAILLGFLISGLTDLVSLIFVIIYLVFIFRYFIFVGLIKSERRTVVSSRSTSRTPSRNTTRVSTSSTSQKPSSQITRSRQVPSPTRTRPTQSVSRARTSSAKVDSGIEITTRKTTKSSTRKTKTTITVRDFFPSGKASKDEMKCIICFMDFEKKETRKIILCPHCKYPAHEDEFLSWYQASKFCARCNKPISTSYVRNPKFQITTKIYIERVIEKL